MFKENTQGLFARPSLYVKLDLQFVRQLNSIGTDYGLLISIKNYMTFTMTWWLFFFNWKVKSKGSLFFTSASRNSHDLLRTTPEPQPHPFKTPINAPFHGYLQRLKAIHGKESSQKRDWRSHLGIELGTCPIAGRAITTVPILAPQKQAKTRIIAQ